MSKYYIGDLFDAVFDRKFDKVKEIIESGFEGINENSGECYILHCIMDDNEDDDEMIEITKYLIEHGADVNKIDDYEDDYGHEHNDTGYTPIHLAADNYNANFIKLLLENGADPNIQDNKNHYNALHHIVSGNVRYLDHEEDAIEAIELLISHDVNINAESWKHKTPLHLAIKSGLTKISKYLIEHGANVNIEDRNSYTPLHLASMLGNFEVVKSLLEHCANPNVDHGADDTPLHLGIKSLNVDVVNLLIQYGADMKAKNRKGETPIMLIRNAAKIGSLTFTSNSSDSITTDYIDSLI